MTRILLVEDDKSLAIGLEFNLRSEGYRVDLCHDAESALGLVRQGDRFDLIILDWMLPEMDGIQALRAMREAGVQAPVLLLTARDSKEDIVEGLDGGADDYLTKPFDLNIMLARIRTLLRRGQARGREAENDAEASFDGIRIRFDRLEAEVRGKEVRLTYKEAMIMQLLWEKRNQVVTREELLQRVWGVQGYMQTRTVDNHIVQLRKIFEENPKRPRVILSAHGSGYKLAVP